MLGNTPVCGKESSLRSLGVLKALLNGTILLKIKIIHVCRMYTTAYLSFFQLLLN